MQSTRQHILDYLQAQRSAGARELALAFGMTAANLRHHLEVLAAHGLVEVIAERPTGGRGRPEQLYALTTRAQEGNTAGLASALLATLDQTRLPKRTSTRLKRVAEALAGSTGAPLGHLTQRLVATVRRLAELGYQPHWEARTGGPQIVLGHCPYAAIIEEHPELCHMDAHLLERLSGEAVEQRTKLEPGPEGTPQCIFALLNAH